MKHLVAVLIGLNKVRLKDRGVIPDYPVYQTISDIVAHKDGQMAYTLKLIEKK